VDLLRETVELYDRLSGIAKEAKIIGAEEKIESVKKEIREAAETLNDFIERSGSSRAKEAPFTNLGEGQKQCLPELIDKGLSNPPVVKPKKGEEITGYEKISETWGLLGNQIRKYIELYAKTYYSPYLKTYEAFRDILEGVKKKEGTVFIHDINKKLSDYLNDEIVPDVYFRIGETIYHYLIDEFQDTSPIQWAIFFRSLRTPSPREEVSLPWVTPSSDLWLQERRLQDHEETRIKESFFFCPSCRERAGDQSPQPRRVVDFSKTFFKKVVAHHDKYRDPALRSGLIDYEQKVKEGHRGSGLRK